MKLTSVCAFLSMFAFSAAAHASETRPAKPDMSLDIPEYGLNTTVFDFPTGLRIMMQPDTSHPVVTAWMLVNYGSAHDPVGKEETAHFVEHMWFRSRHGDLPPVMSVIQDMGARFNATTHNDWTDYRTVASSEYMPLLMRLESKRLTNFYDGVTEEQIDIEREVIRNEWRRRNEQSYALLFDFMYEAVYPEGHGYHNHSNHDSIDNIKLKDLQGFVDRHYKPEHTTSFFIGDFQREEMSSLIFENFAPELLHPDLTEDMYFLMPRPGIENPDEANPDHWLTGAWDPATWNRDPKTGECVDCRPLQLAQVDRTRITDERDPVPPVGTTEILQRQAPLDNKVVMVAWSLPGGYRSDHYELLTLGNLADGQVYSGFIEDIDRKRVVDAGCLVTSEIQNTTIGCYAEVRDSKMDLEDVAEKIMDQLPEVWNPEAMNNPFLRPIIERSRMSSMAGLLMSLDTYAMEFGGRGELIMPLAHYAGTIAAHSDGMQKSQGVNYLNVMRMGADYLKRNRAATVIFSPLPETEIDIGSENSTYSGASATDQVVESSDDLSSVTDEQIAEAYLKPDLSDLIDVTLDNGLRVVVLPHGEAPLVQATLILGRDSTSEPENMFNFVSAFARSKGNDPLEIAAFTNAVPFPGFGRPFNWAFSNAYSVFYRAPSGNLDGSLWMLREEIETTNGVVDGKFDLAQAVERRIKQNWRDREWHISRVASAYLYPDHPRGQMETWEDLQEMKSWGNGEVDSYVAQHMRPDNATLLIVGNIDGQEARELAETYLGGWQPRRNAEEPPGALSQPPMPTEDSKILVFNSAKATQSQVTTSCRLNYSDPEQETAVNVLASLMGTRTFTQLRIREGLAYSPYASSFVSPDNSARLVFASLAVNSGVGRTIEFFNEAIAEVEAGDIDLEEVKLHKLRTARRSGVSAQSLEQMSDKLASVVMADKDWDFLADRGSLIAGVNTEQLQTLLQGCGGHTITTIEGPVDVIGPQLDEQGYEYEVVEWSAYGDELLWKHDPKAAKKREKKRQRAAKKREREAAKKQKEAGDAPDAEGDGNASSEG